MAGPPAFLLEEAEMEAQTAELASQSRGTCPELPSPPELLPVFVGQSLEMGLTGTPTGTPTGTAMVGVDGKVGAVGVEGEVGQEGDEGQVGEVTGMDGDGLPYQGEGGDTKPPPPPPLESLQPLLLSPFPLLLPPLPLCNMRLDFLQPFQLSPFPLEVPTCLH